MNETGTAPVYLGHTAHYQRALGAYYRAGARSGGIVPQPRTLDSGEWEYQGKQYVTLGHINGLLAVYRIKPDGSLKRLRRWPKALRDEERDRTHHTDDRKGAE